MLRATEKSELPDISPEENERMVDLNCRAASVRYTEVDSVYGKRQPRPGNMLNRRFSADAVSGYLRGNKGLLYRYSRALRIELLGTGIHVTAVCPYWIKDTEFIGVAQKTKNSRYIRHFRWGRKTQRGCDGALCKPAQSARCDAGIICTLHRIIAKFIPHSLMMGVWALIRRIWT